MRNLSPRRRFRNRATATCTSREETYLRHLHIGIQLLPGVDSVVDHVSFAKDVQFRVQQLVLILKTERTDITCDITPKPSAATPGYRAVPVSPTGTPAEETPSAGPGIGLCGTSSRISPSRRLRFNVG